MSSSSSLLSSWSVEDAGDRPNPPFARRVHDAIRGDDGLNNVVAPGPRANAEDLKLCQHFNCILYRLMAGVDKLLNTEALR
mmetsp:Transcript_56282/g.174611  ORF Transcript_56282/g.174611 Transcript_56282/m.174611 type:complete len:81 (+) Transcript_56282:231-473(+)